MRCAGTSDFGRRSRATRVLPSATLREHLARMPLRIAINATPLLSPLTGIGNYIAHLSAALAHCGNVDLHAFYRYHWRHEAPNPPGSGEGTPGSRWLERLKPVIPF